MWCTPKDPERLAQRLQRRLIVTGGLINTVVALTVATYLLVLFPPDVDDAFFTSETGLGFVLL